MFDRKICLLLIGCVGISLVPAVAQQLPIATVNVLVHPATSNPATGNPIDQQPFPITTCNLLGQTGQSCALTAPLNPKVLEFDDPVNAGRICRMDVSALVLRQPSGTYQINALYAYTDTAGNPAVTARSAACPFVVKVQTPPPAPTGLAVK